MLNLFHKKSNKQTSHKTASRFRPALESLEDRLTPSQFGFDYAFALDNTFRETFELDPNDDSLYTSGFFSGTRDFDPDPFQDFNLTSNANGSENSGYIAKYSADGEFLNAWLHHASTPNGIIDIAVDRSGEHVYVTGGNGDILVSKFTSAGELVWTVEIGGTENEFGNAIAVDEQGNVYVTGEFDSPTVDFDPDNDPGDGSDVLNAAFSSGDDFTLKLDTNGSFQWVTSFSSFEWYGWSIEYSEGSAYVIGVRHGNDDYVASLDAMDGSTNWQHVMSGNFDFSAQDLTVDSQGNVWTTGLFRGEIDFDPDPNDSHILSTAETIHRNYGHQIYVWKLDSDGNFVWAENLPGGSLWTTTGYSIRSDASGNVYVGGTFAEATDFDPGPDEFILDARKGSNGFVLSLNNDGAFRWVADFGENENVGLSSVAVDTLGNVYASGAFDGTTDLDPTAGTFELTPTGDRDLFVVKLTQPDWAPSSPGISVTPTSGLQTNEDGGTASFTVVLDTMPTADVIIFITSLDTTEGTVSVTQLIFTPEKWNVPQQVIISGVDDEERDRDQQYTIELTATSTDSDYNVLDPDDVFVTNKDNEKKGGPKK